MIFNRKKSSEDAADVEVPLEDEVGQDQEDPEAPKGRPTPRRSDYNKQRVYDRPPTSRKEAAMLQRRRKNEMKDRVKEGMDRGDERYLLARDRGPARAFARNYIDSRLNVATLLMPMAVVVLIAMLANIGGVYQILNTAWLILMIMAVVDWTMSCFKVTRTVKAQLPDEKRGPGLVWYVVQRSLIPRRWRQPKPVVEIGEKVL